MREGFSRRCLRDFAISWRSVGTCEARSMRSRATSPLGTPTTTESSGSPVSNPRFLEFWGLLGTGLAMLPTESSSHLKENIFTICIQRERKKDPRRIDPAAPSSRSLRAAGVGVQAASRRSDDVAVLRQHHPRTPPFEKISRGGEAGGQECARRRRWREALLKYRWRGAEEEASAVREHG